MSRTISWPVELATLKRAGRRARNRQQQFEARFVRSFLEMRARKQRA